MDKKRQLKSNSYYIKLICFIFSTAFLIATPIGITYIDCMDDFWRGLFNILTLPAPLVTDYYQMGNLPSAFFNAAVCGFSCWILMVVLRLECQPSFLAGYFRSQFPDPHQIQSRDIHLASRLCDRHLQCFCKIQVHPRLRGAPSAAQRHPRFSEAGSFPHL